jgi:hypothetical protein
MAPVAKVARVIVFMNIVNTTIFVAQIFVLTVRKRRDDAR